MIIDGFQTEVRGLAKEMSVENRPKRQCARREEGFYADIQGADLGSAGLD